MEQVGRYRLVELIGRTDVASIHRAYEVTGGGLVRPVLLKRMLPDHARRFEHDAVLVEEARIQEQLDHPNVVRTVDLDQTDGIWFSVEEKIEGRDLATMLAKARQRGQKIDHEAALFIAIQVLQGLAHAHARTDARGKPLNIVHRDVAPANVWIGYDGEVRLGGFGYAQIEGRPPPSQPGLDRPRLVYVSPEQALGSDIDHRADVFAAGLIAWELIAGHPAYEPVSDHDSSAKARRGTVPGIRAAAPEAGPEIHEAIELATSFNREQRHESAQVFRDALARILFKREPTYGPSHLASTVARILADEAAEDRKKDSEARALMKRRGLVSSKPAPAPIAPSVRPPDPSPEPSYRDGPPRPHPSPEPAPDPDDDEQTDRVDDDPSTSTFDYSVPPQEQELTPTAPIPPPPLPVSLPQVDLESKPSVGKLIAGVTVLALVGVAVFAFSSETNMRLVKRKAREAIVGRKAGGKITIDSLPEGAAVFFDEEPTGRSTPITIDNVESEMVHVVRLELEGENSVTSTVTVAANATQNLQLYFKDAIVQLTVKTDPAGAEVFKNGRSMGFSPASSPVRVGEPFKLEIKKVGYKPFERDVTPERGRPIAIDATLEKTDDLIAAEAAEAAAMKTKTKTKKKKRR